MKQKDLTYFKTLKTKVIEKFLVNNPNATIDYTTWKGQEITLFQEDFISNVKSGFSEKWFYTYFKNETEKLPRIDMLNLMSQYIGYSNFNEFKNIFNKNEIEKTSEKTEEIKPEILEAVTTESVPLKSSHNKKYVLFLGLLLIPLFAWLSFSFFNHEENHFTFCFVEKSNGLPPKTPLRITVLLDNESPLVLQTDENSCFEYISKSKTIKFVVQSTFHEADTIVRKMNSGKQEQIPLLSNDYALMLKYYTNGNSKDWKKRRKNLNELISKDAKIYRLYPQKGISVYSKAEFIDQLTLPTKSLNNIEIIEAKYNGNQIIKIKFKVSE